MKAGVPQTQKLDVCKQKEGQNHVKTVEAEGRIEPCKDHANRRDDGTMYSAEQLCGGCLRP